MSKPKSAPLYGNWRMLSPTGALMCRCSEKRAKWYLSRGLATEVEGEAFQLLFAPNGVGNADQPDMLLPKQNRCVVCGSSEDLNRHHVVPYQFRRHMPLARKSHSSSDIVAICLQHHELYELSAHELSRQIASELGLNAPSSGACNELDRALWKTAALARLILRARREGLPVPKARVEAIQAQLEKTLGSSESETLDAWLSKEKSQYRDPECQLGKLVIDKVMAHGSEKDLQSFEARWRKHFMDLMRPKHLSTAWASDIAPA